MQKLLRIQGPAGDPGIRWNHWNQHPPCCATLIYLIAPAGLIPKNTWKQCAGEMG